MIETPPAAPLPDPAQNRDWYGEIWVMYPKDSSIFAVYFGYVFKSMVELHVLMAKIASQVFSIPNTVKKLPYDEGVEYESKLDSWYGRLPKIMSPRSIVFPARLKAQYVQPTLLHQSLSLILFWSSGVYAFLK